MAKIKAKTKTKLKATIKKSFYNFFSFFSLKKKVNKEVKKKTKSLNRTLLDLKAYKAQQELDYFLMSQLVNPLSKVELYNSSCQVEVIERQKKQFVYRNQTRQIGGDFFRASQITIEEYSYVLFVNADAMGKSLQGASGVIVLGSVLEANIDRLKVAKPKNLSPERFLKNLLNEIFHIFETFHGAMMVSLIAGVIDELNGFVYYANIEHPPMILFEEGQTKILQDKFSYHKFGRKNLEQIYYIETLKLTPRQALFFGSDGKDDVSALESPHRRIEDPLFFARLTEKCNGDLEKIRRELSENYILQDDLSLAKIQFSDPYQYKFEFLKTCSKYLLGEKNLPERIKTQSYTLKKQAAFLKKSLAIFTTFREIEFPLAPSVPTEEDESYQQQLQQSMREWILQLPKLKLYDETIRYGQLYLRYFPEDETIMLKVAVAARICHELLTANNLSERLRLRNPYLLENNLNLIKVYLAEQNIARAAVVASLALNYCPRSTHLRKTYEMIIDLITQRGKAY